MSYQVLARKWRPRTFREMVGQEHVLQALINALDHDRLHHAYLFTGTRGVGKTTIARILAKCINCEVGVSSVPCNECSACTEINQGRFVDLIEVDAASRTKVEDTRELLENVQYAPTRGRYKVYLIDEVHMLSNSSFNALLKTLEEPPPHVKFLLATTDPQKLPVTILSRCLQFNLKNMNPERIVSHLQFVLEKESVPFDEAGLWQLARSADGSMRDALSLTDQSIAFGDGKITDADVRIMLGTIDQSLVYDVLQALIAEDVALLLKAVADLAEHSPDYSAALAELIATLHRVAIAQALPEAVDNSLGDRQQIYDFSQAISAEDVQLYYQTALLGRRDLPLVPDPRSGFEMVLLRMLAFKPQGVSQLPKQSLSTGHVNTVEASSSVLLNQPITADTAPAPEEQTVAAPDPIEQVEEVFDTVKKCNAAIDLAEQTAPTIEPEPEPEPERPRVVEDIVVPVAATVVAKPIIDVISLDALAADNWFMVYAGIDTGGLLQSTVANCQLIQRNGQQIHFVLDEGQSTLYDEKHQQMLADLLSQYFSQPITVTIAVGQVTSETPAQRVVRCQQERQLQAEHVIAGDPVVQQLEEIFNASIIKDSIKPM